VLFVAMLLYEAPLVVWAAAQRRSVLVTVSSTGAQSQVAGAALPTGQALVLVLAGSALSILLGCALLALTPVQHSVVLMKAGRLQTFWGAVQLLPLLPFKLGVMVHEQLGLAGRVTHAAASMVVALAALAWFADRLEVPWVLVGFGIWLGTCAKNLWQSRARLLDERSDCEQRLREVQSLTLSEQARQAVPIARDVVEAARSVELQARASRALAWAAIGAGDIAQAHEAMARLPESLLDAHLVASYLATVNRTQDAIALLNEAKRGGLRSHESLRLLADLYYRQGNAEALATLAKSDADLLDVEDLARIQQAVRLVRRPSDKPQS
jgi:hypothetical protein